MSQEPPITGDDLQAFADDALPAARRAEIAAYLAAHPEAAAHVDAIVAQTAALRAAAAPLLDPHVPSHLRVAHLLRRQQTRPSVWQDGAQLRIAAALVAGVMVGAAGGWGLHPSGSPFRSGVRPLVEEAADTYATFEPDRLHPVEIAASDKDALMSWTTSRLGRPVSAPDTLGAYRLLGGRVVATSRGPAAMFMYEAAAGRRVVLMICPLSVHGTAPITASTRGDLKGVSWSDQGVGYSLVGPLARDALRTLGEDMRRQQSDKA